MAKQTAHAAVNRAKLILYNLLVFFVLANALYWSIPVIDGAAALVRATGLGAVVRDLPPGYLPSDREWVAKYWVEVDRGAPVYKSYIGWRRAPQAGETVNVEGPYLQRRTVNAGVSGAATAYFFGGSSMWGNGASDVGTIPSQFAAITGMHSENFAEGAWVAHQSLEMLIKLLQAGHRPNLVVFYDGANDVLQKCRRGIAADAHGREQQFDQVLRSSGNAYRYSHYFAPVIKLAENLAQALPGKASGGGYDCHSDEGKAEAVAQGLVRDWEFAKQLAEWHGGKFIGLLQPVAYLSRTRLDHLSLSADHAQQYRAVYPRLRDKLDRGAGFHDLTSALDMDEPIYLDWCHLPPKGNRYVTERIVEIVASLGLNR